jgi:hypothetical protein
MVSSPDITSFSVSCPAGSTLVSGGFSLNTSIAVEVAESIPGESGTADENTWFFSGYLGGTSDPNQTVIVRALCLTLGN